jgi:phage gp36-like protein
VIYDVGDVALIKLVLTNDSGQLVDATGVVLKVKKPDGTTTTYTFGTDPEVAHLGTGVYQATITLPQVGRYLYRWETTGPQSAEEGALSANVGGFQAETTYCTVDEVKRALRPDEESKASATAANLSDSQLQDAITEATNEINAVVAGAPFTAPFPPIVATLTRDIAAYLATLAYRKGNPLPDDHPARLRYARAEMLLDKAAAGKLDLTLDVEAPGGEPAVENPYEGDLFTLEGMGIGPGRDLPPWTW